MEMFYWMHCICLYINLLMHGNVRLLIDIESLKNSVLVVMIESANTFFILHTAIKDCVLFANCLKMYLKNSVSLH